MTGVLYASDGREIQSETEAQVTGTYYLKITRGSEMSREEKEDVVSLVL